jgi:uncharacterized membrane-anchored protein YjiN (DUF445 family)
MFVVRIQKPVEKLEIQKDVGKKLIALQERLEELEAQSEKVEIIKQTTISEFKELCHEQVSTLFNDEKKMAAAPTG